MPRRTQTQSMLLSTFSCYFFLSHHRPKADMQECDTISACRTCWHHFEFPKTPMRLTSPSHPDAHTCSLEGGYPAQQRTVPTAQAPPASAQTQAVSFAMASQCVLQFFPMLLKTSCCCQAPARPAPVVSAPPVGFLRTESQSSRVI